MKITTPTLTGIPLSTAWLVAYAYGTKPCNKVENAATRHRVPLTSAHGLPDHRTSDGGTRCHRVSATVQSALEKSAVSVRERYTQQDDRGLADAADVREGECRSCSHSSHTTCRMQDGTRPSRGILSATLTSIANVCALRADISGGTAVVIEHSPTVRRGAPYRRTTEFKCSRHVHHRQLSRPLRQSSGSGWFGP